MSLHCYSHRTVIAGFLAMACLLALPARAQYQAPRGSGNAPIGRGMAVAGGAAALKGVEVRELIGTGRRSLVRAPEYKTNIPKSSTRAKDWAQITVKFDTAEEWIDVLAIEYHVMCMTKLDGQTVYSLSRQTVEHLDVERGREHMSAVFIPPSAVKRHGPPAAVYVRLVVNGETVAEKDEIDSSIGQLPATWWKDRSVLENPKVTSRDGNLWRLSATPFAFVNPDDYEVMR